jgi:hypothetical protein
MRKRIAIAVLAIVGVGILAHALTEPKEGSIEWHKREYFKARGQNGSMIRNFLRVVWSKINPRAAEPPQENIDRMDSHYEALMKLGYLEEKAFLVSNRTSLAVADTLFFTHTNVFADKDVAFSRIDIGGTNIISIISPRDEMYKWERLIREADVPEEGN